jgi:Secreted and surface protein containing fasciclin-like repeats
MKFKYLGFPIIVTLIVALSAVSCSDVWDEHYNSEPLNKSNLNLYQYISADTTLSKFTRMLQITHYDSLLSQSQSYTVWAPTNASLAGVDLKDSVAVSNIVGNHITRFSYSTSILGSMSKILRMFDKKLLPFEKTATGFAFAGKTIIKPDLATKNGIVHIVGEYAPYTYSFWEYINNTPGLDSLKTYLNSMTVKTYDLTASFQDGVFVDSVFKSTNIILDKIAALNTEDSIYTAILPTNAAWSEAYARIAPYFKSTVAEGGAISQMKNARLTLVKDLFYRGKLINSYTALDTLKTTLGNKLADPTRLFIGAQKAELSNGFAYSTDKINIQPTESWFPEIRVEAEWASFAAGDLVNYTQYPMSSIGTGYAISGGYFMKAESQTNSSISKLYANFQIPRTLSAKYNIYCVFAPISILSPNDARSNKIRFYLSYVDATGKQITNAAIDANNLVTTPTKTAATFTTTPLVVQKMLVAKGVVFPFCNLLTTSKSTVMLKVENAATVGEAATFSRNLLIDCIILEPVLQ